MGNCVAYGCNGTVRAAWASFARAQRGQPLRRVLWNLAQVESPAAVLRELESGGATSSVGLDGSGAGGSLSSLASLGEVRRFV